MRYNLLEGGEINSEMQTLITPTLALPRRRGRESSSDPATIGGCVVSRNILSGVILSEAKNLFSPACYCQVILRLAPQNDNAIQSPGGRGK